MKNTTPQRPTCFQERQALVYELETPTPTFFQERQSLVAELEREDLNQQTASLAKQYPGVARVGTFLRLFCK